MLSRRTILKGLGVISVAPLMGVSRLSWANDKRIVIIGGGAAGVIAAKYLKLLVPALDITLVEKNKNYKPTFGSNQIIGGKRQLVENQFSYDKLAQSGINLVYDSAEDIDSAKSMVQLKSGKALAYDRLILATGVSLDSGAIPGLDENVLHAWYAGNQIESLSAKIKSMKSGGSVLVAVPQGDYSGPWAPFERVSQIASYFSVNKQKSKIILLNANDKPENFALFEQAWGKLYPGMIEALFKTPVTEIAANSVKTANASFKPDVANIIPPNKANSLATKHDLVDESGWCTVEPGSFRSKRKGNIYVIGDAISSVSGLSKTAQCANGQAKLCAMSIANEIAGKNRFEDLPPLIDSEYSIIGNNYAVSNTKIFRVDSKGNLTIASSGVSAFDAPDKQRLREVFYAESWFNNITQEMFG